MACRKHTGVPIDVQEAHHPCHAVLGLSRDRAHRHMMVSASSIYKRAACYVSLATCLAQNKCFAPGVFCTHDSLRNNGLRGSCVQGCVSWESTLGHEESPTRGEMSAAA